MAKKRRSDSKGKYKSRVEEAETYKDIAGVLPGIGTAITVSDIEDELSKEDPSYLKVGILGASEAAGLIPGIGSAAKTLIRKGVQKLDEVKDLTKNADSNALEQVGLTEEALEAWKAKNYAKDKFRIPPHPKLTEAAEKLRDGKLSQEEYITLSKQIQPIVTIKEMPKFPSKEDVVQALHATDKRKVEKGIIGVNKEIPDGTQISARLDIPAYNDTDTWIVSLHDGTEKSGATVGYAQTAVLTDVKFTTNPLAASAIASGKPKTTIARMNGSYVNANPDDVYNYTKDILENEAEGWTQVGMNPTRASYFYDKSDGMPVVSADEVVQVGPLVMAKNVTKTTPDDVMFQFTNKRTGVTANFSEGGMALEEQMEMNFGDVPDNTIGQDPVSGNDIPLGSTAENVRDDIPANLSEGEIVVPADVVNFHGVKLFEDLRKEAKIGYAQMAEDGRIGGEPMMTEDELMGLDLSDLEIMETDDEPVQMNRGGTSMADYAGVTQNRMISKPKPSGPRQTHEQIMASIRNNDDEEASDYYSPEAISKRVQARKGQPKNNLEKLSQAIAMQMAKIFGEDEDMITGPQRVYLDEKPATSDDAEGPSIAEQINFGGDYTDVDEKGTKKKKKKKEPPKPPKNEDTFSVRYNPEGTFTERFLKNTGLDQYFDEGGMVTDDSPFENKGGFDMSEAGETAGRTEARMYMNDQGHKIVIMFVDGVPVTPIPEGYFPVGETVDPDVEAPTQTKTAATPSGGGGGDMAGIPPELMPKPVDYKSLTLDELKDMVEAQNDPKQKAMLVAASAINPLIGIAVKFAMAQTAKQTKEEIERRAKGGAGISNVDKMRYENLLEIVNREQPNLLDMLTGKSFEKTAEQITPPKVPDVDFSDPTMAGTVASPYTPEVVTPEIKTTAPDPEETVEQSVYDPIPPAGSGFGGMGRDPAEEFGGSQTRFQQPTEPEVIGDSRQEVDSQRRKNRQEESKNLAGQSTRRKTGLAESATRGLDEEEKKGGAGLDTRFGISGLNKGGIVDKPTVKKVVKGLKKASKSHAKQAATLEKAINKKSK